MNEYRALRRRLREYASGGDGHGDGHGDGDRHGDGHGVGHGDPANAARASPGARGEISDALAKAGLAAGRDGILRVHEVIDAAGGAPSQASSEDWPGDVSSNAGADAGAAPLYFDIETWRTRGGESRVFLLGYALQRGGTIHLVQELARDRAEEALLLARALDRFDACREVVTYNGKSFDLPFMRRRLYHHGMRTLPATMAVVDLMHLSRKRYRRTLPDYRLTTLERLLLQKERPPHDVPGAEVPLRYQDFLDTGDLDHLVPVIVHNREDVLSMVGLHRHLHAGGMVPDQIDATADRRS